MADNVEEFLIKFGFAGQEALNGLKKFRKQFDDETAKLKTPEKRAIGNKKEKQQSNALLQKQNTLLKTQNLLRGKINQAQRIGLETKTFERSLAAAKKVETLQSRILELDKKIKIEQNSQIKHKTETILKEKRLSEEKARQEKQLVKQKNLDSQRLKQQKEWNKIRSETIRGLTTESDNTVKLRNHYRGLEKDQERLNVAVTKFRRSLNYQNVLKQNEQAALDFDKRFRKAFSEGNKQKIVEITSDLRDYSTAIRRAKREVLGLTTAQNGLRDSTRNMIRSYVSLFAVFTGVTSINKIGQDFETLNASMLIASGNAKQAEKDLQFVRKTARDLGIDLLTAAKSYQQIVIAGKDQITLKQSRDLFLAIAESSVALGMSMDDTKGTARAFVQMLSKGNVQAEELRGQLGERLLGAVQLAAKSLKVTTQELNKMLKDGKVLAKDLLPEMTLNIRAMAREGGALEKQLNSTRVAQNRFFFELQNSENIVFRAGFGESIKEFFDVVSMELKGSEKALEGFGKLFGLILRGITKFLQITIPWLESFGVILGVIADNIKIITALLGGLFLKNLILSMRTTLGLSAAFITASSSIGKARVAMNLFAASSAAAFLKVSLLLEGVANLIGLTQKGVAGSLEVALGKDIDLNFADVFPALRGIKAISEAGASGQLLPPPGAPFIPPTILPPRPTTVNVEIKQENNIEGTNMTQNDIKNAVINTIPQIQQDLQVFMDRSLGRGAILGGAN